MKALILTLLGVSVICMAGDPQAPLGVQVGTNSTVIMGPRSLGEGFQSSDAIAFVAGQAVTNGQIIVNGSAYYLVVTASGTNGVTAPTHTTGDVTSGSVVLRRIEDGRRKGLMIVNNSTNRVFCSIGYPAVNQKGIMLVADGGTVKIDGLGTPQGYVAACAASGAANLVTAIEW